MTTPQTPDIPVSEQAEQIKRLADRYAEECVRYDNGDCSYPSVKDERDDLRAAIDSLRARAEAAEQELKAVREDAPKPLAPKVGDYVLATKWSDGDPGDPWALGYYLGEQYGRHLVKDGEGKPIRAGGYRYVGRITTDIGNWLWRHRDELVRAPSKINLWKMYDWAFVNEQIMEADAAVDAALAAGGGGGR
jgi:hypothetical protein